MYQAHACSLTLGVFFLRRRQTSAGSPCDPLRRTLQKFDGSCKVDTCCGFGQAPKSLSYGVVYRQSARAPERQSRIRIGVSAVSCPINWFALPTASDAAISSPRGDPAKRLIWRPAACVMLSVLTISSGSRAPEESVLSISRAQATWPRCGTPAAPGRSVALTRNFASREGNPRAAAHPIFNKSPRPPLCHGAHHGAKGLPPL